MVINLPYINKAIRLLLRKIGDEMLSSMKDNERMKVKGIVIKRRYSKEGNNHYALQIQDESGTAVNFCIYEKSSLFHVVQNFKEQDSVEVDLTLISREKMEATMHYISKCDLVIADYVDTEGLIAKFKSFLKEEMRDKVLKKMLINGLTDTWVNEPWFNNNFFTIPASKNDGYAFKAGLLARTVRLLERTSREIDYLNSSWSYNLTDSPTLNKDICLTAIMLQGVIDAYIFELKMGDEENLYGTLFNRETITIKMVNEANQSIIEKYRLNDKELSILQHIVLAIDPAIGFTPNQREAQLVFDLYELDRNYSLYEQFDRIGRTGLVNHNLRSFYTETYKSKVRKAKAVAVQSSHPFGDLANDSTDVEQEDTIELKSAVNEFN